MYQSSYPIVSKSLIAKVRITHLSKTQSFTLDQASSALSSVSYQTFLTWAIKLSLFAAAVSLVSTPFCFKTDWS